MHARSGSLAHSLTLSPLALSFLLLLANANAWIMHLNAQLLLTQFASTFRMLPQDFIHVIFVCRLEALSCLNFHESLLALSLSILHLPPSLSYFGNRIANMSASAVFDFNLDSQFRWLLLHTHIHFKFMQTFVCVRLRLLPERERVTFLMRKLTHDAV